jgi:hypothetical protein
MMYSKFRQYDSDCYMVTLDSQAFTIHATNTNQRLEIVSSVAKRLYADIVINGDGWDSSFLPLSIAASEGTIYQPSQYDYRPLINFSKSNVPMIDHRKTDFWNTVSGTRYMVKGGVKQSGTSSAWTERNPRTAIGIRTDGFVILLVVDGRTTQSAGVTLHQLADILAAHNAKDAIELDGGGSSAMWVGDKIINVPSDGRERPVVNHLVFKKEKNMSWKYEYINTVGGMSIRPAPNTNNTAIGSLPVNTKGYGNELYLYSNGDKWVKIEQGGNAVGWVAVIHAGKPYGKLTELAPTEPPPPPEPVQDFMPGGASLVYDGTNAVASITIPDGITLKIKVNGSDISWSK